MPAGMLSVQKLSGRPTTTVSIPASIACAAVAIPYGPPPITTSTIVPRSAFAAAAAVSLRHPVSTATPPVVSRRLRG